MHEHRHALVETRDGRQVVLHELSVVGGLAILAEGDEVLLRPLSNTAGDWQVQRTGRMSAA